MEHNSLEPWVNVHALELVADFHRKHLRAAQQIQTAEFDLIKLGPMLDNTASGCCFSERGVDVRGHSNPCLSTSAFHTSASAFCTPTSIFHTSTTHPSLSNQPPAPSTFQPTLWTPCTSTPFHLSDPQVHISAPHDQQPFCSHLPPPPLSFYVLSHF